MMTVLISAAPLEFASRVPKAGSAYVYSYVCVGEFVAFIIGWNLILEYVIGTASVARGLSNYIDALTDNVMHKTMVEVMPININFLSDYPDFLAFGIIMLLAVLLAIGVKESTIMNNLFTVLNMIVIAIVIVAGSIKADVYNWNIPKAEIPANVTTAGEGGFMPFGVAGVMAGAAKCFYGFVGFDCIATTGEEAKNPQRSIPIAIVISLIIIFLSYFGISTVLTMMWPYYDQDSDAPLPYVFMMVGWPVIKWIVTVGAVFALCTSLLGAMFPLPRILYAMAMDGLLFRFLAKVHPRSQTPLLATILSGLLAGVMATIFDLQQLIDMMSIGTLLAYTIVAICVMILRYEDPPQEKYEFPASQNHKVTFGNEDLFSAVLRSLKHLFNLSMIKYPDETTTAISRWAIVIFNFNSDKYRMLPALALSQLTCSVFRDEKLIFYLKSITVSSVLAWIKSPVDFTDLNGLSDFRNKHTSHYISSMCPFAVSDPELSLPVIPSTCSLFTGVLLPVSDPEPSLPVIPLSCSLFAGVLLPVSDQELSLPVSSPPVSDPEVSLPVIPLSCSLFTGVLLPVFDPELFLPVSSLPVSDPELSLPVISLSCSLFTGVLSACFCASIVHTGSFLAEGAPWAVILVSVLGISLVITIVIIGRQPASTVKLSFKVPLVPLIPGLSIVINVYLMLMLDSNTWIRFTLWLAIGEFNSHCFLIYFFYGLTHSEARQQNQSKGKNVPIKLDGMNSNDVQTAEKRDSGTVLPTVSANVGSQLKDNYYKS
uniref:Cationic amino acid transporter C-terminal domain-containing protein n=1 Tax=Timema genevievae TaxID=629358 RepID=A0A7R9K2R3_TIMGE|nr:unnamed protein product [Timema genevievae]